jgi:hypothetical protein
VGIGRKIAAMPESSLQDVLTVIAKVPKDADRRTLIATIDTAVDGVISSLRTVRGDIPVDLLKATKVALEFLEQCGRLGDPQFRGHIKSRATQLHHELSSAASGTAKKAPAADASAHTSFEPAYCDYFCAFLSERLQAFQIDSAMRPKAYVLNKDFEPVFLGAVRAHVLPEILKGRRIRALADSMNVADFSRALFFEEFSKDPTENPTRILWDGLLDDFRAALAPPPEPDKKKKDEKSGGIAGLFGKKAAPAAPKKTATGDRYALADKFLKQLTKGAKEKGFDPPRVDDFRFFRALMDYNLTDIEHHKKALFQFLMQENLADEEIKVREGATRDWLYRIVDRLPPHCGELLALWAYHQHSELFSQQMLRSFVAGQGTTEEKRERTIPLFWRWMKDVIGPANAA